MNAPFVIYADFECLTERTGTAATKELKPDRYQLSTSETLWVINVVNAIDGSSGPFLYRGEDCMGVLAQKVVEVQDITITLLSCWY